MAGDNSDDRPTRLLASVRKHGGQGAVDAIHKRFGGTTIRVPIPAAVCVGHPLAECLGFEVARAVCADLSVCDADGRELGNFRVPVPLGPLARANRITEHVKRLTLKGMGVQKIALHLGCSERTVWRRRAEMRRQGLLVQIAAQAPQ